jgi:hypothetical protein
MAYFNYERKLKAVEDIATCYECAEKASIKDKLFVNFGLLLGIVRENDFIGHDNDVDMCIHTDDITKDQLDNYIEYLREEKMFFHREKIARRIDNEMATWFTLRRTPRSAKFCHWAGFNWQGFWWWSKSGKWVRQSKFNANRWGYNNETQAIALGIPSNYLEKLMWIEWNKIKIQIPEKFGHVLDWEYPGWPIPQSGSSRKQVACIIQQWNNQRTWKIIHG